MFTRSRSCRGCRLTADWDCSHSSRTHGSPKGAWSSLIFPLLSWPVARLIHNHSRRQQYPTLTRTLLLCLRTYGCTILLTLCPDSSCLIGGFAFPIANKAIPSIRFHSRRTWQDLPATCTSPWPCTCILPLLILHPPHSAFCVAATPNHSSWNSS